MTSNNVRSLRNPPASVQPLTESPVREDIRTSQIPPRLAEDGEHVRSYSPVLHDTPLREIPAVDSSGKKFGTNVLPEAISLSGEQARGWLQLLYGQDVADSMIGRALTTPGVVNGELVRVQDSQARTKGKLSITTDKSRPGMFVLVPAVLRQSGGRRK
jgi:hypothetical protein